MGIGMVNENKRTTNPAGHYPRAEINGQCEMHLRPIKVQSGIIQSFSEGKCIRLTRLSYSTNHTHFFK